MSVKISELPILDSLADNDVIAGVDTSANVTSKIEMATLKNYIDTNTQYTAGTNIDITNNVVSAPNVYNKTETDGLIDDLETNINEQLEEKDEQIEELQSEVDSLSTIYNAFPTESGEGESLTLDDTAEVKFKKFDLKGNTSQTTYSGKNLFKVSKGTFTKNGVTATIKDSIITLNGTATANVYLVITSTEDRYSHTFSGNYTISKITSATTIGSALYGTDSGGTDRAFLTINNNTSTKTQAINDTYTSIRVQLNIDNGATFNNTIVKIQLESGSSATDFEPFVGATASPNPSYPQPVNVVSGDNEINVEGKNILKFPDSIRTFSGGVNVETSNNTKFTFTGTSSAAYYNSLALDYYLPKGIYTMSSTNNNFKYYFWFRDKNNAITYANVHLNNSSRTFTLEEDSETIIVGVEGLTSGTTYNIETYFQLEKGDSATSYESFNGDTYNVSLPIKNLFDSSLFTNGTVQGITLTKNSDGTITLNGTSTARADFTIIDLFSLKGNDKISSISKKSGTTTGNVTFGIYDSNWANGKQCYITSSSNIGSASLPSEITLTKCFIRIETGITLNNLTIALQIEQGSKANTYTPYGTTPIELCKIGNYQDYFAKSDGRNLFDKDNLTIEVGTISATGTFDYSTERLRAYYIEVDENTTYTISTSSSDLQIVPYFYNSSKTFISFNNGWKDFPYTFTTPSDTKYIALLFKNSNNTPSVGMIGNLQLEKGSSATYWQPYGVGKWYLHKEIGKVVLNGSENWNSDGGTQGTDYRHNIYYANRMSIPVSIGTNNTYVSNYFGARNVGSDTGELGTFYMSSTWLVFVDKNKVYDLDQWKNWLSTNNVDVYYVLATPTTEEITYEPLIDQLNLLEKAISYDSQTNISQVNNDLGFIIYAEAIKSLENVLDRLALVEE